jgi:hypothetical protein
MMTRTAPEEFNLAAYCHDQDPTAAEFTRTYMSIDFQGGQLLQRLKDEERRAQQKTRQKFVPKAKGQGSGPGDLVRRFVDFYGYRGSRPAVYYLIAWEFVMLWEVLPLPRPKAPSESVPVPLTKWKTHPKTKEETAEYEPNPAAASGDEDAEALVFFYGTIPGDMQLKDRWYMQRRMRPMVPATSSTPMPDKAKSIDEKTGLFSLYMRPWVIDAALACQHGHVPHISDLDIVQSPCKPKMRITTKSTSDCGMAVRSYSQAWSAYVRVCSVCVHTVI